jgi:hypothetical protein
LLGDGSSLDEDVSMNDSTRRDFAKVIALAAAAPLVAGAAQEKPKPLPAAEALTEIVRARYGQHLTDEQISAVQASIGRTLRSGEQLKKVKLQNGDEPAFAFRADVPGEE